jgi:hypothetical protein
MIYRAARHITAAGAAFCLSGLFLAVLAVPDHHPLKVRFQSWICSAWLEAYNSFLDLPTLFTCVLTGPGSLRQTVFAAIEMATLHECMLWESLRILSSSPFGSDETVTVDLVLHTTLISSEIDMLVQ